MNLHIKKIISLLLLFSCFFLNAQEDLEQKENTDDLETVPVKDDHYGIFMVGAISPIAFGNNFAKDALNVKTGAEIEFLANLFDSDVLIGAGYSIFAGSVTDKSIVGNYDNTTISYLGVILGYHLVMEEHWRAHVQAGVGGATYRNENTQDIFNDNAFSYSLKPVISYHFNKTLGLYFSSSIRRDNLRIRTAEEFRSFFTANYLNINLGFRLVI